MQLSPISRSTSTNHINFFFHFRFVSFSLLPSPSPSQQPPPFEEESIENRAYWSKQIHNLCNTKGQVDEALRLIDRLRLGGYRPDFLNLNTIIHALCNSNRFSEAHHRLFLSLTSSHSLPDERTCNVLIARLLHARTPLHTLRVVRALITSKPAFVPSLINFNRLIHQFCSSGLPFQAHRLLFEMISLGHTPNTISYTALLNGFCQIGQMGIAQKLFDEMCHYGILPNPLTHSVLIGGLLRTRRYTAEEGRNLMQKLWSSMPSEDQPSVNHAAFANLIRSLCTQGFFYHVYWIAEEMPQGKCVDDEFAYCQMIDCLCRAGQNHGASRIVYIMRTRSLVPSLVSYNSIVHGLSKDGRQGGLMRAYQLFDEGIEFGYLPSEPTYKVLVEGLCLESDIDKAKELLRIMLNKQGIDKTRIYNIFLRALCVCRLDNPSELLNVLVSMLQNQCQPDVVTLNTVINGFCKMGRVEDALKVFNDMLTGNLRAFPDAVTFTTVISGLLGDAKTDEALHLLHKTMPETDIRPTVVTYNALLRGLFKLQKIDQAMKIFTGMVRDGVVADSTSYTIMIEGLCGCNKMDEAKEFWDNVVWPSRVCDDFVYSAILKGFCRWGRLNEACDFLYELIDCGLAPNIVNYNIIIDGACKLGLKKEAYQIVGEMRKNGLSPDAVTWRILDKLHGNAKKELCDHGFTSESKLVAELSERNLGEVEGDFPTRRKLIQN